MKNFKNPQDRPLNHWMYKGYSVWQYQQGYIVEETRGEYHKTLEEAKKVIDEKVAS